MDFSENLADCAAMVLFAELKFACNCMRGRFREICPNF